MVASDRIHAVKDAAVARLRAIPGVHAVGVGAKYVGGKPTNELCILVIVGKKKPLAAVPAHHLIPSEIDGIKTDVEQGGPFRRAQFNDSEDTTRYAVVEGGMRISPGARGEISGTLGCIVQDAQKNVCALTCNHVVGTREGAASNLQAAFPTETPSQSASLDTPTTGSTQLTFSLSNASDAKVTEETIVFAILFLGGKEYDIIFGTNPGYTTTDVARSLAADIVQLGVGFTATNVNNVVTINPPAGGSYTAQCLVFGPEQRFTSSSLGSRVVGSSANSTINLSGSVNDDFYGLYSQMHFSGVSQPTQGVFVPTAKGTPLNTIATNLSNAINAAAADAQTAQGASAPAMHATNAGAVVTVTGPSLVICEAWPDVRVGQPDANFSSCGNHQIGKVVQARLDYDAALIQLDDTVKYNSGVLTDPGGTGKPTSSAVTGSRAVGSSDVGKTAVQLRGMASPGHSGTIRAISVTTNIAASPVDQEVPNGPQFHPHLVLRGILVQPDASGPPFGTHGDSGSALIEKATGNVLGILYSVDTSGSTNGFGVAQPIVPILTAFGVQVSTAANASGRNRPDTTVSLASALGLREPGPWPRIDEVAREVAVTPSGIARVEMVRRHTYEVGRLVNKNRRVGVAWQRGKGPLLVRALMQTFESNDCPLPSDIGGKPLEQCIDELAAAFRTWGSRALAQDVDRIAPLLRGLAGKAYPEVLALLRSDSGAAPSQPRRRSTSNQELADE
jgi:hypothetical protein